MIYVGEPRKSRKNTEIFITGAVAKPEILLQSLQTFLFILLVIMICLWYNIEEDMKR